MSGLTFKERSSKYSGKKKQSRNIWNRENNFIDKNSLRFPYLANPKIHVIM